MSSEVAPASMEFNQTLLLLDKLKIVSNSYSMEIFDSHQSVCEECTLGLNEHAFSQVDKDKWSKAEQLGVAQQLFNFLLPSIKEGIADLGKSNEQLARVELLKETVLRQVREIWLVHLKILLIQLDQSFNVSPARIALLRNSDNIIELKKVVEKLNKLIRKKYPHSSVLPEFRNTLQKIYTYDLPSQLHCELMALHRKEMPKDLEEVKRVVNEVTDGYRILANNGEYLEDAIQHLSEENCRLKATYDASKKFAPITETK